MTVKQQIDNFQRHTIYNPDKKELVRSQVFYEEGTFLGWGNSSFHFSPTLFGVVVLLSNSNDDSGGDLHYSITRFDYDPNLAVENNRKISIVSGRWVGDRVIVQGDYATQEDPWYISPQEVKDYVDISNLVKEAISVDAYIGEQLKICEQLETGQLVLPENTDLGNFAGGEVNKRRFRSR